MDIALKEHILAIITTDINKVASNTPVFVAQNKKEAEHLSLLLSRILKAMAHDLENGVYIIVKH